MENHELFYGVKKYTGLDARFLSRGFVEQKENIRNELAADTAAFLAKGGKITEVGPVNEPVPTIEEINEIRAINKRFTVHYNYKTFEWHVTNGGNNTAIFKRKALAIAQIKHETAIYTKRKPK